MAERRGGLALFGRLAVYYDRLYESKDYAAEARLLRRIARAKGRSDARSLLDVACGTGRHLAEFRRFYPAVAGVDLSPEMLRIARRRLGPGVPLARGDMRSFDLGRRFDVIVCMFSAFGYMRTRKDRDRALATIARHLAPGGVVLIEGWIRPTRWKRRHVHLRTYQAADVTIACLTTSHARGRSSTLDMQYLVAHPGGRVQHFQELHRIALVPSGEILGSFRRAGLRSSVLLAGRWAERGLYIGVAPGASKP